PALPSTPLFRSNDSGRANLAKDLTNAGTIIMGDASTSSAPGSVLGGGPAVTLTNNGHLNTITGGGGGRDLHLNISNAAGGSVDIAGPTFQDSVGGATVFTNNGTVTVEASGALTVSGGSTFVERGTVSGNAVDFEDGA